jgi:hypothetical protein
VEAVSGPPSELQTETALWPSAFTKAVANAALLGPNIAVRCPGAAVCCHIFCFLLGLSPSELGAIACRL